MGSPSVFDEMSEKLPTAYEYNHRTATQHTVQLPICGPIICRTGGEDPKGESNLVTLFPPPPGPFSTSQIAHAAVCGGPGCFNGIGGGVSRFRKRC